MKKPNLFGMLLLLLTALSKVIAQDFYGIKTPYSRIQNDDLSTTKPGPQCVVKQVNMVHRHGHRFPSKSYINKFTDLAKTIRWDASPLLPDDILSLPWDPPLDVNHKNHLTIIGQQEMYNLGIRLRGRFPKIFHRQYNTRRYKFLSTNKVRTTHSSTSLAAGLFDGNGSISPRIQPIALETSPDDDKILRFYDACVRYKREIESNLSDITEFKAFLNGPEIQIIFEKVRRKLGLVHLDLTYQNVDAIFIGCAYEVEMFGGDHSSGLCSLLDADDRLILEYAEDIANYYSTSNTNDPLSFKISCPLLTDIAKTLQEAVENKSEYLGIFRSSHSSAILMLYTLLGLNKQKIPLRHNNFADQQNRPFKSSTIAPFSANAYFVLYECSGKMKIQLYWNERLQKIPCCESKADCDFEAFQKCYEDVVSNCKNIFEELCQNENNSTIKSFSKLSLKLIETEEDSELIISKILVISFSVLATLVKKYFFDHAWRFVFTRKE